MRDEVLEHGKSALLGTVWERLNRRGPVQGAGGISLFLPFHFTSELTVADRRQKREIRQLEQELHKWQVLVDSITGEVARGQRVLPDILVPLSPSLACLGVLFTRPSPWFPAPSPYVALTSFLLS